MLIKIKEGMDVPVAGAPEQRIHPGKALECVALLGLDHLDLRPSVQVEEGERVLSGQTVFADRADPRVRYVAPGSGRIVEVNRGPRRSLLSVVIELQGDQAVTMATVPSRPPAELSHDEICETLLAAGLWPSLRARPFGRVAAAAGLPTALFVTAIDTNPLAADPRIVVLDRAEDFAMGLAVVSRLAPATWLCTAPGADLPCPAIAGLAVVEFAGKHPAGGARRSRAAADSHARGR
jgi:Na+-transporting NADH:ubiquinone oxidoreductase subunit A